MKGPARAIAGQLVWSADGGAWAVWQVEPFPHAHRSRADKLTVHARLRGALIALPSESMLLSVCERIDSFDVVADMLDGVDIGRHQAWASVCEASAAQLLQLGLHRRRYYLVASLGRRGRGWRDALRLAGGEVCAGFGVTPAAIPADEIDARQRQARELEVRCGSQLSVRRVTAGEIRWLYARALRRPVDEPPLDESWNPSSTGATAGRVTRSGLAVLADVVVHEGGTRDDHGRPRHRRYVRIDTDRGPSFQSVLAVADMPHEFTFPGGGGEWLFHADDLGFPIDWCVRLRSISNVEAQAKVRRQHRQLIGQVDEYDGELTGAPPSLAEAISAIDTQRTELAANPAEPELQATILFSIAATSLPDLEDQASALTALFEPHEYGLARPTGGQTALLRSMLPGSAAAAVCRDYTQFLLPRDLAAGAPFCGPEVGDPHGLLLGVAVDSGTPTPVLLDPTYGPAVGRTASLGVVGALGSGKSFFLKRICWDAIARGGQIVTIDRTSVGEYAAFADVVPGRADVVRLAAGSTTSLDPLRSFTGEDRISVTLGFLSLLAGCPTHSDEGAALAEAIHAVAGRAGSRLGDVIDELRRMAEDGSPPDEAARALARRLDHYRRLGAGQLAFGDGTPVSLDADCIVFWAPNLALPDRDTLLNEHLARQMLPEQVLGHALLYLVAAVGRHVVFRDPTRFGAALYDEAWALLASPHGQRLLLEGVRDGRKHNGAIWLASQHPDDLGTGELVDLLGARFVFRQAPGAIGRALEFLGAADSDDAAAVLERGLPTGHCLYRDVRDRIGLIQVLPPVHPELAEAFDTTPGDRRRTVARPAQQQLDLVAHSAPTCRSGGSASTEQARARRRTPLADALANPSR